MAGFLALSADVLHTGRISRLMVHHAVSPTRRQFGCRAALEIIHLEENPRWGSVNGHIGDGFQPTRYGDYLRYRSLRFFSRISFHNRNAFPATRSIEYTSSLS